jgi:hypothetical protein
MDQEEPGDLGKEEGSWLSREQINAVECKFWLSVSLVSEHNESTFVVVVSTVHLPAYLCDFVIS